MFCGTHNIPHNILYIQYECGEYFMKYCQSHKTLLWIRIMLSWSQGPRHGKKYEMVLMWHHFPIKSHQSSLDYHSYITNENYMVFKIKGCLPEGHFYSRTDIPYDFGFKISSLLFTDANIFVFYFPISQYLWIFRSIQILEHPLSEIIDKVVLIHFYCSCQWISCQIHYKYFAGFR